MTLLDDIRAKREVIMTLATRYRISQVRVFGSVARGQEDAASDIDLLVSFVPGASAFDLLDFTAAIGAILPRQVDVISDRGIHWYLRDRILSEAQAL